MIWMRLWPALFLLLCVARTPADTRELDPAMPVLTWWEQRIASLGTEDSPTLLIPEAAVGDLPGVMGLHAAADGSTLLVCRYPEASSYSHVRLYRAQPPDQVSLLIDLPVTELWHPYWWQPGMADGRAWLVALPPRKETPRSLRACWAGATPTDYTLSGADDLPEGFRFLAPAGKTESGGLIAEDALVLDGAGRESARFGFDPDLAIPSYFPYSIGPSRARPAYVVAAVFRARRQSNGPPPSWVGVVHVRPGQAGPLQIVRPGSEDLSPPASLGGGDRSWTWATSWPLVLAGRSLVAYRATLRISLGMENLAIAALRVCDLSGHSRLIDFVARYHTEGSHEHDYVWTFGDDGRPVERWNKDWLEDEVDGWRAELASCAEPRDGGIIYLKRGALWRAPVRRP